MRQYDLAGNLVNDFCIHSIRILEYETDAISYLKPKQSDQNSSCDPADNDDSEWYSSVDDGVTAFYHPKATARLRAYIAGNYCEGLMTADGHIVTMPSYTNIEAIGPDLYLCTIDNSTCVIVNGKGQVVK